MEVCTILWLCYRLVCDARVGTVDPHSYVYTVSIARLKNPDRLRPIVPPLHRSLAYRPMILLRSRDAKLEVSSQVTVVCPDAVRLRDDSSSTTWI